MGLHAEDASRLQTSQCAQSRAPPDRLAPTLHTHPGKLASLGHGGCPTGTGTDLMDQQSLAPKDRREPPDSHVPFTGCRAYSAHAPMAKNAAERQMGKIGAPLWSGRCIEQ